MGWDVALDLIVPSLGALALAPCVARLILRLVREQAAQESLGPSTARPLGAALRLGLGLAHIRSVGGGTPHPAR
jgi:hypothetical protein